MEYNMMPDEFGKLPEEDSIAPEYISLPDNEFYGYRYSAEAAAEKKKKSIIKQIVLVPSAAVIAAISLIFASLNFDPLGIDLLNSYIKTLNPNAGMTLEGDLYFPTLENLNPDFEGNYAWSGLGSEEYVRFDVDGSGQYTYLEMGSVWKQYGGQLGTVSGASYDKDSNTLTLENCKVSVLDVNLMGNGFKINLVGDNYVDKIVIWGSYYGGSLTLTGEGKLTVNKDGKSADGVGITINGEWSQSCLMIDSNVTLDVYGEYAIVIGATKMEKAVYYLNPIKMTGGERSSGEFVEYASAQYDAYGNYIGEKPITLKEISEQEGVNYYDYSIVDEDGKPSKHVTFEPQI